MDFYSHFNRIQLAQADDVEIQLLRSKVIL